MVFLCLVVRTLLAYASSRPFCVFRAATAEDGQNKSSSQRKLEALFNSRRLVIQRLCNP